MRLFFKLLVCLVLAYLLAAYIAIPANPEIRFWHSVDQLRDREIAALRLKQPGKPIIFFTGGSSCAFSIDPKIIEDTCGMPAFNLGLPVAAGPKYLLHQALEKTRPGDFMVINLESDALTYTNDFKASQFGLAMAVSRNQLAAAAGGSSFGESLSTRDGLNLIRPGPHYIATRIGKALAGRSYRYRESDIRYRGRIETHFSDPTLDQSSEKKVTAIVSEARELLQKFRNVASSKGVKVFYSMPWVLTMESSAEHNRSANTKILASIDPIIPTLDDGYLGVAIDPHLFSDSGQHLNATGSAIRSSALAEKLNAVLKADFQ